MWWWWWYLKERDVGCIGCYAVVTWRAAEDVNRTGVRMGISELCSVSLSGSEERKSANELAGRRSAEETKSTVSRRRKREREERDHFVSADTQARAEA
jgi:hypothetical protein